MDEKDLDFFFQNQQDEKAIEMAAFTTKNPKDREVFDAHWQRLLNNKNVLVQTIEFEKNIAGHIASYEMAGQREVTYWVDRSFWGKGIATAALMQFLDLEPARPLYARVAKDNEPSKRVLQKCHFQIHGEDKGYANGRGCVIEEWLLKMTRPVDP